jgi:hypothetical protein
MQYAPQLAYTLAQKALDMAQMALAKAGSSSSGASSVPTSFPIQAQDGNTVYIKVNGTANNYILNVSATP